jgi:hypothetical protein
MTDDIVAELDRWLRSYFCPDHPAYQLMQRAHDEVVALRDELKEARAEAWGQGFEAAKAVVIALDGKR